MLKGINLYAVYKENLKEAQKFVFKQTSKKNEYILAKISNSYLKKI
jgi:hypothetical protein